jgi:hypothetical protein
MGSSPHTADYVVLDVVLVFILSVINNKWNQKIGVDSDGVLYIMWH